MLSVLGSTITTGPDDRSEWKQIQDQLATVQGEASPPRVSGGKHGGKVVKGAARPEKSFEARLRALPDTFPPSWDECWKKVDEIVAGRSAEEVIQEMRRKSCAASCIAAMLMAASSQRHIFDQFDKDFMALLQDTIKNLPLLTNLVRIRTAPCFRPLVTSKNEVLWLEVCRKATVDDIEALRYISKHKRCPARAKVQLGQAIVRLQGGEPMAREILKGAAKYDRPEDLEY